MVRVDEMLLLSCFFFSEREEEEEEEEDWLELWFLGGLARSYIATMFLADEPTATIISFGWNAV